jgi:hypothetical protein
VFDHHSQLGQNIEGVSGDISSTWMLFLRTSLGNIHYNEPGVFVHAQIHDEVEELQSNQSVSTYVSG